MSTSHPAERPVIDNVHAADLAAHNIGCGSDDLAVVRARRQRDLYRSLACLLEERICNTQQEIREEAMPSPMVDLSPEAISQMIDLSDSLPPPEVDRVAELTQQLREAEDTISTLRQHRASANALVEDLRAQLQKVTAQANSYRIVLETLVGGDDK